MTIINGAPGYYDDSLDTIDRVIKLPNITIEFCRTKSGGWEEIAISYKDPHSTGGGAGHRIVDMMRCEEPRTWIPEQMWRRIMELEDELHVLKSAIAYKGKG